MTFDNIKKYFLSDLENEYPIPSDEVWGYLGYARHSVLLKALRKDPPPLTLLETDDYFSPTSKRKPLFFTRELFYDLCLRLKHPDATSVRALLLETKQKIFENKILRFENTGKKKMRREGLRMYKEVSGHFYQYSLDTINIAEDIGVCPFELFKFCSLRFATQMDVGGCSVTWQSERYIHTPYFHFDSIDHPKRYLFLVFLNQMRKEFPLTELQKEYFYIYVQCIENLIEKQFEYDIKAGKYKRPDAKKTNKLSSLDRIQLKRLYKDLAKKYHPDTTLDEEKKKTYNDLFAAISEAYATENLDKLKEYYFKIAA